MQITEDFIPGFLIALISAAAVIGSGATIRRAVKRPLSYWAVVPLCLIALFILNVAAAATGTSITLIAMISVLVLGKILRRPKERQEEHEHTDVLPVQKVNERSSYQSKATTNLNSSRDDLPSAGQLAESEQTENTPSFQHQALNSVLSQEPKTNALLILRRALSLTAAVLCLIAALFGGSEDFYKVLRFVVISACGTLIWWVWTSKRADSVKVTAAFLFGFVAVLFNPLLPLDMDTFEWNWVQLGVAVLLVGSVAPSREIELWKRQKTWIIPSAAVAAIVTVAFFLVLILVRYVQYSHRFDP